MKFESQCIHAGYQPKNGEACALPIVQSTTFRYESTAEVAKLFDLTENGFFYTRLGNPTMDAVEQKIADLEGGVGALLTSTGQAAALTAVATICKAGDHIIASSSIYGGTFNLLGVTLKRFGISVTFVDQRASDEEIEKAFRPETRAVFGETIANPALTVFDIERFAALAHKHGVPLIVDNTFATPYLCRPFEYGADIIVHSTTKYMEGQAVQMGGVVVDSGRFDWTSGKFPEFTDPDPSYHGTVYTKAFDKAAFIVKARVQIMRDLGCCHPAGRLLPEHGPADPARAHGPPLPQRRTGGRFPGRASEDRVRQLSRPRLEPGSRPRGKIPAKGLRRRHFLLPQRRP